MPTPAEVPGPDGVPEHLRDADLRRTTGIVLEADHPEGDHRAGGHHPTRPQLDVAVVGSPAPEGLLLLTYRESVAVRLLADGAADRSREVAGLDP
jgi:hypothetical protein